MGSPTIFSGKFTKLLTQNGVLTQAGAVLENDGAKNYLPKGNAESTNPFVMYADGASATPVDGTGGSPSAVISISSSSPLSGSKSFVFTSGSQGDGGAYSFTIDSQDKSSVQTLIISTDGAFAQNDLSVWLYDVTNSQLIYAQPTQYLSNAAGKQKVFFQLTTGTSYRFLIHQSSANSFTAKFEVSLSAMPFAGYAPIFTDPVSFDTSAGVFIKGSVSDPTYGTVTRNLGMYSRQGSMTYYTWQYERTAAGSAGSGNYLIKLPFKMDLTKYGLAQSYTDSGFNLEATVEGDLAADFNGSDFLTLGNFYIYDESTLYVAVRSSSSTYAFWSSTFAQFSTAGTININLWLRVHTLGQSAQTQVISEYNGRTISLKMYHTSSLATTAGNPIVFGSVENDKLGMYNTSTGEVTIKVAGRYKCHASMITTTSGDEYIKVYKNGTLISSNNPSLLYVLSPSYVESGSNTFDFVVGDIVTFRTANGRTLDYSANAYAPTVEMELLSGAQQISAGERVFAKYKLSTDTAVSANDPLPNDTKVKDTHGAYNTTTKKFVVPANGDYRITANAYQSGGAVGISVYADRNGTDEGIILHYNSSYFPANGSMVVTDCVVGDELSAKVDGATTLDAVNNGHQCTWITFEKLN